MKSEPFYIDSGWSNFMSYSGRPVSDRDPCTGRGMSRYYWGRCRSRSGHGWHSRGASSARHQHSRHLYCHHPVGCKDEPSMYDTSVSANLTTPEYIPHSARLRYGAVEEVNTIRQLKTTSEKVVYGIQFGSSDRN